MRLSTRGRYAVMAMVELAMRQGATPGLPSPGPAKPSLSPPAPAPRPAPGRPAAPVSLAGIAAAQQISLAYLEQLFGPLRRAGLVQSARGPGGGYRLARPPEEIVIAEIIRAVDEPIRATRCEEGSPGCLAGQRCRTHDLWAELGEQIRFFLEGMTLADVVEGRVAGRAASPKPAPALTGG